VISNSGIREPDHIWSIRYGALPKIVGSGSDYALSVDSRNNVVVQELNLIMTDTRRLE